MWHVHLLHQLICSCLIGSMEQMTIDCVGNAAVTLWNGQFDLVGKQLRAVLGDMLTDIPSLCSLRFQIGGEVNAQSINLLC